MDTNRYNAEIRITKREARESRECTRMHAKTNSRNEESLALIRVIRGQIRFLSHWCQFVFIRG